LAAPRSASASRATPAAPSPVAIAATGLVPALAVPLLFLHVDFQPTLSAGSLSLSLSDLAVLAVAAAALAVGRRDGFGPLAPARWIWLASGALLAWLALASVYPLAWSSATPAGAHLVSAAKFAEYALLAPALVLLLRTRRDLYLLLGALVAWSVVATTIGLLQYLGVDMLHEWTPGNRQPSLLGVHEFASFSTLVLAVGLASLVRPPEEIGARRAGAVAIVAGGLGLVLSGSIAGGIGLALAAAGLALHGWRRRTLDRRRFAVGTLAVALVLVGLVSIRSGDLTHLARFVGFGSETPAEQARVQTYSQRTLMTYVGYRMWRTHPVLGIGWSGATEPANFEPQLPATHARFPDQPPLAFPARAHPWPIDNAYVQALAELGVIGAALFALFLAAPLVSAARTASAADPRAAVPAVLGGAAVLVAVGVWTGQGISPGTPHAAVAWIAVGLVALGRSRA
jgi:hypothetical protein